MNTATQPRPLQPLLRRTSLALVVLSALASTAWAQTLRETVIIEELEALLDELAERDEFSGTVLLARGDEILFEAAHGLASRRYDVPNDIDTRFHMGSMNKMFTGVAVCQLAEQGKLDFDDFIVEHLPDYPNRKVAESVTIHHLLTHTSGMGSYWNEAYMASFPFLERVADYLPLFVDEPLAFEPGSEWSYSNNGPVVLGLIIEAITGQDYFDYVDEHVLRAAGMMRSGHWSFHEPEPNVAMGYTQTDMNGQPLDGWRNNVFMVGPLGSPAGGAYTNVRDMLHFSRALQSGKLLSPEMYATMIESKIDSGRGMKYGYLHGDESRNGVRVHGHNGGGPGVSCEFAYYPDLGYTLVILSNISGGAMKPSRLLKEKLLEMAARVTPRSKAILGTWEMETETDGGTLLARMVIEDLNGLISGTWESNGRVTALAAFGFVDGELSFVRTLPDSGRTATFEGFLGDGTISGVHRIDGDEIPCYGQRVE